MATSTYWHHRLRVPASTNSEHENTPSPSGTPGGLFAFKDPSRPAARSIVAKWPTSSIRGSRVPAIGGGCTSTRSTSALIAWSWS